MDTKQSRPLAFLLSEAAGARSRNNVTIASGSGIVEAGTVIGEITASNKFAPSPDAEVVGIEGAETATAILAYGVDATTEDVEVAVVDRDAEVKVSMLKYDASIDDQTKTDAKIAQLNAVGIRAR